MKVDLAGRQAVVCGGAVAILDAIATALAANGCAVARSEPDPTRPVPDILVVAEALKADDPAVPPGQTALLTRIGERMAERKAGRIVVLLSALAAVPARRFPDASVAAGAAMLGVRTLAMRLGPSVLVNAIGCGAIVGNDGVLRAGHASMLSHVPTGQSGAIDDIVHAALFLCDQKNSYMTGQLLTVDGGWSPGYGRNF